MGRISSGSLAIGFIFLTIFNALSEKIQPLLIVGLVLVGIGFLLTLFERNSPAVKIIHLIIILLILPIVFGGEIDSINTTFKSIIYGGGLVGIGISTFGTKSFNNISRGLALVVTIISLLSIVIATYSMIPEALQAIKDVVVLNWISNIAIILFYVSGAVFAKRRGIR